MPRLLLIILLLMPSVAAALTVELEWDPNTEPDLAGYRIYYKCGSDTLPPYDGTGATEGDSPIDVGLSTTGSVSDLPYCAYFWTFSVTAYNTSDMESAYSSVVVVDPLVTYGVLRHVGAPAGIGTLTASGTAETALPPQGVTSNVGPMVAASSSDTSLTGQGAVSGIGAVYAQNGAVVSVPPQGATSGIGSISADGTTVVDLTSYGAIAGIGPLLAIVNGAAALPSQESAAGIGTVTAASSIISTIAGRGATAGIGNVTAPHTSALLPSQGATSGIGTMLIKLPTYTIISVNKTGLGSGNVIGGGIDCGGTCSAAILNGSSITLNWERDATGADLLSWGGACQPAERRPTCTITADAAALAVWAQNDTIPVSVVTGYFAQGACRTGRGTSKVALWDSLQHAYNAVALGQANNPIDCTAPGGDGPLVVDKAVAAVLVGGWIDFFPGQIQAGLTAVTGGLVISRGSLQIGDAMGGGIIIK